MAARVKGEMTSEVQGYLDKHKISSLFQDLMSKLVKELPVDPIEFLISKLQLLKQRKPGALPHPGSSSDGSGHSKIQVTGTSVKPAASKPTLTPGRPTRPSSGIPTPSKTTPTKSRLPKATPTKGSASKTTPTRPTTSSGGAARSLAKTTPSKVKSSPAAADSKRPTTAPAGSGTRPVRSSKLPSAIGSKPKATSSSLALSSSGSSLSGRKEPGKVKPKSTTATKHSPTTPKSSKKPSTTAPQTTASADHRQKREASTEEIDEFFGEAKKSSVKTHHQVQFEDDEESDGDLKEQFCDSDELGEFPLSRRGDIDWSDDSDWEYHVGGASAKDEELDFDEIIKQHQSSKQRRQHGRNLHSETLSSLFDASDSSQTTPTTSSGYGDSGEEESDVVELVEECGLLEDEGVAAVSQKYAVRKAPPPLPSGSVDLKVLICAHCAKVMTSEDQFTEVTKVTSTEADFESASQVGSHTSFPQWDTGSALGSQVSGRSHDAASDVTLQSHDTWGGLAPQPRPQATISDEESEIQLPPGPLLEGKPWSENSAPLHDPHGWAN